MCVSLDGSLFDFICSEAHVQLTWHRSRRQDKCVRAVRYSTVRRDLMPDIDWVAPLSRGSMASLQYGLLSSDVKYGERPADLLEFEFLFQSSTSKNPVLLYSSPRASTTAASWDFRDDKGKDAAILPRVSCINRHNGGTCPSGSNVSLMFPIPSPAVSR